MQRQTTVDCIHFPQAIRRDRVMPVQKYFWEDPYCQELSARITSVDGNIVTIDRTIFYALSGGQDSDAGTIGGYPVVLAKKDGLEIYYMIQGPHTLQKGDQVAVVIDWERRYRLMRLHFAAEIILELVYQYFDRPQKIGANIGQDKARIDFLWEGNISRAFPVLQKKATRLIEENRSIISEFSEADKERRYWKIEGFAQVSCGGTHIRSTSEVGAFILKRKNIGKGKERIEILLQDS